MTGKMIFLFISIILFSSSILFSQSTSTYTRYGIGDIVYSYSARTLSMGNSGSAMLNKDYVEVLNPASWSGLARTRLEFSYAYQSLFLSTSTESKTYGEGIFKGLTFAFPVSDANGIAIGMGLVPYSRLDYIVRTNNIDTSGTIGNYASTYSGKGGLSKLFLGGTYKLPFDFIFGGVFEYYFGNLKYTSEDVFEDDIYYNAKYELLYSPSGFGTTLGMITPDLSGLLNSESISNLRLAISANIVGTLTTDTSYTSYSASLVDSIAKGEQDMEVPFRINGGISVVFANSYSISVDYFYQPWSEFNFNSSIQNNLKNLQRISAGFEYRPLRELGDSFWELIMLRAGLGYEQSQYTFKGNDISGYSVSGGFSLPLSLENTIDFGFEYSTRGTKDENLLQENFITFNLGISFGDVWFIRYEK